MNDDWSGGWFDDEPKQKPADTWSDDEDAFAPKTVAKKASVSRSSGKSGWDDDWDDEPAPTRAASSSRTAKAAQKPVDDWDDDFATPASAPAGNDDWGYASPGAEMQRPNSSTPVATVQPRKTGHKRKIEPMPDAFAIRSTKGRSRSSRRLQRAQQEEEDDDDFTGASSEVVTAKDDEEDDFLGLSSKASKPHVRKHVDQDFDDFGDFTSSSQSTSQRRGASNAGDAGSFWDDNAGEDVDDWDEPAAPAGSTRGDVPTSVSSASSRPAPKKEGIDHFLDGLGSFLNINISDNVHNGVKKSAESVMNLGSSLWSGFASLISEEYALNMQFTIDGKQYTAKKKVAEGGFSVVYLVADAHGSEYALKVMNASSADITKEIEREIKLLKMLKHPNIMPAIGMGKKQPESGPLQYLLLTPYYSQGTVWDEISEYNADAIRVWPFTEARCLRIFYQTCLAVKVLHDKGLVHRDIKPHNIMLQGKGKNEKAILIDFGSVAKLDVAVNDRHDATNVKEDAEKHCSAAYRAPELYDPRPGMNLDGGVDIWALGCTLYAMAFGTCPFESPIEGVMKLAILDGKFSFPKNNTYHVCTFSNPFCKFIRFMLRVNIEERITIDDCIEKTKLLLERCPPEEQY